MSIAHRELLDQLYERTQLTVDELPYTEAFERLHESFVQRTGLNLNRQLLWRALASQRKSRRLSRKRRPAKS